MQLWAILQDLHQLKHAYGPRAGTFLANAGVTQVFNVNDVDTAALVSRALGGRDRIRNERHRPLAPERLCVRPQPLVSETTSTHLTRRPLLTPDEVRRLAPDRAILLVAGEAPVLAKKLVHHADPEFCGLADPRQQRGVPLLPHGLSRFELAPRLPD